MTTVANAVVGRGSVKMHDVLRQQYELIKSTATDALMRMRESGGRSTIWPALLKVHRDAPHALDDPGRDVFFEQRLQFRMERDFMRLDPQTRGVLPGELAAVHQHGAQKVFIRFVLRIEHLPDVLKDEGRDGKHGILDADAHFQ